MERIYCTISSTLGVYKSCKI